MKMKIQAVSVDSHVNNMIICENRINWVIVYKKIVLSMFEIGCPISKKVPKMNLKI